MIARRVGLRAWARTCASIMIIILLHCIFVIITIHAFGVTTMSYESKTDERERERERERASWMY